MNNVSKGNESTDYGLEVSKIIEGKLVDLYGVNGYRSILKTIMEKSKRTEKEILKINPEQRIIFASANLEEYLRQSISELGKIVEALFDRRFGVYDKTDKHIRKT